MRTPLGVVALLAFTSLLPAEQPTRKTVRERLERKVTAKFRRAPLHEALATIGDAVDLRVVLDGDALKAEGYTLNMPQDAEFAAVAAGVAITRIVGKYPKLTFLVDDFGDRVVITTEDGRRKLQKPAGKPEEDAAWRSLVTSEQLAAEMFRIRDRLRTAIESERQFKNSRLSARQVAQRFVVVAQLASQHPDGLHDRVGQHLAFIGRRLGKAYDAADGFGDAKQALRELDDVLRQRSIALTTNLAAPPEPAKLELVDVMHTFYPLLMALQTSFGADADEAVRRQMANRIATAAAAARLARSVEEYSMDAEFLGYARGLERDLGETRNAVEDGDFKAFRVNLEKVETRCSDCHRSFR